MKLSWDIPGDNTMILYVKGNLLQSPAQVLVNTVNTVGVMGKGIALEYKRIYPEMYDKYRELCETGQFGIGMLWLYKSSNKWVLNFPTKQHWRSPSDIRFIEAGLKKFVATYADLGIHSIAFPALGCGNGQLDFESQVQPLMVTYLRNLPIETFIYPGEQSAFIEHLNPAAMEEWLRSEPTSLPFSEVWDDLVQLLDSSQSYKTIANRNSFSAHISQDPLGIQIETAKQRYFIPYETLQTFWQQLRTHGFSMSKIAPGINKQIYYLIPIFAQLDYVTPVHISDEYSNLQNAAATGLQILPSAFIGRSDFLSQPIQMSLFEVDTPAWAT
jgi:O-acetyl-ADP-ribose deacetylase (regulator of RNase III)